jgi:PAS domain S-box-containing protein
MAEQQPKPSAPRQDRPEPRHPNTLEGITAAWREVNDAFRDSERRYRELVEYSLGLICTHDLAGTITSINPAAAGSLGYRPEDGIGRNLREFLSPDKRDLFDEYLQRIQQHGHDAGLMSVVTRTGESHIWMYRNVLSRSPDGTAYVLGHAIDITDRVAAERQLRQNEQVLRAAHAELESRVRDRTAELERANERLRIESVEREQAERSRRQALVEQRDTLGFLANVSEWLAPIVAFEHLVEVSARLPVPFLADWTVVHLLAEDATLRMLPSTGSRFFPQSALQEPVAVFRSGEPPPSFVQRVIATGQVSLVNVKKYEDTGEAIYPAVAAADLRSHGVDGIAMIPLMTAGRVRAILSLLARGEGRFAPPRTLVIHDFARRLGLALDRIQLYREAQEANRLKDEFLSTLSHELRTPLSAIFGWARILQRRPLDSATAHGIDVIHRNAEAQIRLIEEVLDVSRIVAGKMAVRIERVDLASILRASLDAVRPAVETKRIRLEERIDDVPAVAGDPERLQQVLSNVLSNAVKFTGRDGSIHVSLSETQQGVACEITDTGVGIRRDVLPFVFDRFRQADSSTTRTHGGLGLGLAIARHIVERHGGTIRAASAGEGRGATFTIELPVTHQMTRADGGTTPVNLEPANTATPPLRGRTILVVEDHDDARELIVAVLGVAGARVMAAATTAEALEHAGRERPDLMVADLGLPGEDGYSLLGQLRRLYADVPAVALTAYARTSDRDRALASGFQHHLVKPMDPKWLVELIASLLA